LPYYPILKADSETPWKFTSVKQVGLVRNESKRRIEVSSDAAIRVQIAREWVEAYPADTEILVLAHSVEAASDLHLSVVSSTGSSFGIKRFTLNVLASRLAQHTLADSATAPASALSFTAVVARAIHSLHSGGKLSYFAPVATRPGFPVAVAKTLEELRMNEVSSESLERLERGGRDLAAIAGLLEQELKQSKLSDRTALFRAAVDSLSSSENATYHGQPLLLLDVAVRSRLENKLIRELAALSPDVLATVPEGDAQTISALEESLRCTRNNNRPSDISNSLSFAKQNLFQDSTPPVTPLDQSVRVNSWPGEPRECVEIVRSIQAEAARGVPFDQMAVLLHCPGEFRSHLEEAFSRAQLPVYFAQGSTAPDPAGRAMLALLLCAAENLSARGFAEYLSLGQVPDVEANKNLELQWVAPGDELVASAIQLDLFKPNESAELSLTKDPVHSEVIDGSLRTPSRWERLLVDSAVIGGKERWSRRLEGLANELRLQMEETAAEEEAKVESIKRQLRDLEALKNYALPLIERLSALPASANWSEWLVHLRDLAVNALRYPEGVLTTLADLEQMGGVGPIDLHEVQLVLGPRLHDLAVKPTSRRYGSVFVGSVDSARGLSFQVVFIPGLAERVFPRKLVEDPIMPDKQRGETGVPGLATRRDQLELERLALRIAVGAARQRAYLSYPRIDVQQSRPRVPSFYALEALRAAEGVLPGFEEIAARAESTTRARLGWPAPERPEAAIDEAEYDLALLASLVGTDKEEATGRAHYLLTTNSHLARALRGRSRRWLRRWTQNDGLVDPDELARQSIISQQFSARSFSATALQNYASCPYRFFLSAILRLELRQEPAAIEAIDPLTRGSLFHEAQFEVLTGLKAAGLLPLDVGIIERAFELVDRALERLAQEYEDRLAPAIPRVWQDGINSIRADLREWLRRMAEADDGWVPEKYELSFGLTDRGPRNSDPDSVSAAVEVIGDLKLRGSIDLVEQHASGKYRVTDHKTGKARAPKETIVGAGKYLQPLLYALAAQKLLNRPVESGRLYYCTADGGFEERVVPLDELNLQTLSSVLIAIRQGLADAFLPAAPEEGACAWCDFLAVCGSFEEVRTSHKPGDRLVQLEGIRKLP
jgi:ATP-dependent helicase/nuclease subunit B